MEPEFSVPTVMTGMGLPPRACGLRSRPGGPFSGDHDGECATSATRRKYLYIAAFCSTIAHSTGHAAFQLNYIAILLNFSWLARWRSGLIIPLGAMAAGPTWRRRGIGDRG